MSPEAVLRMRSGYFPHCRSRTIMAGTSSFRQRGPPACVTAVEAIVYRFATVVLGLRLAGRCLFVASL